MADAASPVAFEGGLNLSVPPILAPEHFTEHPEAVSGATEELQNILKTMRPKYGTPSMTRSAEVSVSVERTPEQKREDILKDINQIFTEVLAAPDMISYDVLQTYMWEAKKLGIDVSAVEPLMPDIKRAALRSEVDQALPKVHNDNTYQILDYSVRQAEKAGVDVSDVRAKMPELKKKFENQ